MQSQTAVLWILALAPFPAPAQTIIGSLSAECVEVNTKVGASFQSGDLAGADAALSEFLLGGKGARDVLCAGLALHNLAVVVSSDGQFAKAEALEERALKILYTGQPNDPALLRPLLTLWSARFQQGKAHGAREAFQALRSIPVANPVDRAIVSGAAAEQLMVEGRYADAEREFQNALREWDNAGRGQTVYAASLLTGLGSLYVAQGRYREAERVLQRDFEILSSSAERLPLDRIDLFAVRGSLRTRQKNWRGAEEDLRTAIATADRETGLDPAMVKLILVKHAFVLRKLHRKRQARSVEDRAASIEIPAAAAGVVDISQLGDAFKRGMK
jgi:tetratricopeptide (TPR) repeat protein